MVGLVAFRKKKKYHGEVFLWYMCGYGIVRVFVEQMRTDQLIIGNTGIPASQLLAGVLAVGCGSLLIYNRFKHKGGKSVGKLEKEDDYTEFVDETV